MAVSVEVMYNTYDPNTETHKRSRVDLDAAHSLDREDVWYVIASAPVPTSVVPAADVRRTIDGIAVDRLAVVSWDDSENGIAFLVRRNGFFCLQHWEEGTWTWIPETDSFITDANPSGADPTFPKDALVFHMMKAPIPDRHAAYALALYEADVF